MPSSSFVFRFTNFVPCFYRVCFHMQFTCFLHKWKHLAPTMCLIYKLCTTTDFLYSRFALHLIGWLREREITLAIEHDGLSFVECTYGIIVSNRRVIIQPVHLWWGACAFIIYLKMDWGCDHSFVRCNDTRGRIGSSVAKGELTNKS